jgi:Asp-tRNA(Asn)/Glu-tRNA(Gln) amidotransferase A subunit family amidase
VRESLLPGFRQPMLSLVGALRSGELSLSEHLEQLEHTFDAKEPLVQAFVSEEGRFERLRREAADLMDRFPQPLSRPPLYGVPVGIKDIFHVDGHLTRAGSTVPPTYLAGREGEAVARLKAAGALIVGKTVTTEFAYFGPGQTRNPYDPSRTPGGSSSGSAAAVAAGLCALATGTQTIGSITRPAAFNGIVGYKPSYDRISRAGVIPLAPSLDHVGVFAIDVAGAELAASLLCPDWQLAVVEQRPVLGVPEGPYMEHVSDEGREHFERICDRLTKMRYRLQRVPVMADFDDIAARHQLIVAAEAAQVHADWFAQFGELYHPKTADLIEQGRNVSVGKLAEALTGRKRLRQQLMQVMDEQRIDLWISPSAPGPAPTGLQSTGDPIMNLPWTHSGLPTVGLPAGLSSEGLPMGLQVAGRWYEDEMLLEWVAELELPLRREPDDIVSSP